MKKNLIFSIIAIFATSMSHAQSNSLNLVKFQVDDNNHYLISNAKPNTWIDLYTSVNGGKMLSEQPVDAKGKCAFILNTAQQVDFAHNLYQQPKERKSGTGQVTFFKPILFLLQNMSLTQENNTATLNFDFNSFGNSYVSVQVFKKTSKGELVLLKVFNSSSSISKHVAVSDASGSILSDYVLEVMDSNKNDIFYSKLFAAEGKGKIVIYPTFANNTLHYKVPNELVDYPYQILDYSGKTLFNGKVDGVSGSINISSLVPGFYFLTFSKEIGSESFKFTKQ